MYNLILIDDDENQLYLNRILFSEKEVFQRIQTFDNPSIALDHIKQKKDISNDIVIVDINMPQMTAWEFLDALNVKCSVEKKNSLKLFVASFSDNPRDIHAAKEHKLVTSFISKEKLIPSMTNYLRMGTCSA